MFLIHPDPHSVGESEDVLRTHAFKAVSLSDTTVSPCFSLCPRSVTSRNIPYITLDSSSTPHLVFASIVLIIYLLLLYWFTFLVTFFQSERKFHGSEGMQNSICLWKELRTYVLAEWMSESTHLAPCKYLLNTLTSAPTTPGKGNKLQLRETQSLPCDRCETLIPRDPISITLERAFDSWIWLHHLS